MSPGGDEGSGAGPLDIVYIVKARDDNHELRYSLRSLANVPHGVVWLVGYRPTWVRGVRHLPTYQQARSKYTNGWRNITTALRRLKVDRFVLFNDDFFVTRPITEVPTLHAGPLAKSMAREKWYEKTGPYPTGARETARLLVEWGIDEPLDYELHVPFVIDRRLMSEVLARARAGSSHLPLHRRTLYGNVYRIGGTEVRDCKVIKRFLGFPDDGPFVSTQDRAFNDGRIGRLLRAQFPTPSPYERV